LVCTERSQCPRRTCEPVVKVREVSHRRSRRQCGPCDGLQQDGRCECLRHLQKTNRIKQVVISWLLYS
jgi:hypothetical protein